MSRLAVRTILISVFTAILILLLSTLRYHWDFRAVWAYRALYYQGFINTILVSFGAIILGLAIGLSAGLARVSRNVWLSEAASLYVGTFRGTPLLTQIYIFYFCVAVVVHYDNPFIIGMVTLAVFSGAYITEMVRAGIESIEKGQWEAAMSTGMTHHQTLLYVIFPQAFRRIVPPVTGQFVSLIKDSSLLSVISVRELTKASEIVNATTYKTFEAYLPLAIIYLLLTFPFSALTYRLEKRMNYENRNEPPSKGLFFS